jgi:uncharacterized protein YqjF (DUF2071 family)
MFDELTGVIDRRLLVNFRVDPTVVARMLPSPLRVAEVDGYGIAGICLIRLTELRPKGLPRWVGLRSENAAHRIAVDWDGPDGPRTGVYIPRRDTSSRLSVAVGGRLYPGEHHLARFTVDETADRFDVRFASRDGSASVAVRSHLVDDLPAGSVFATMADASAFFEQGSVGFSATRDEERLDGLRLETERWHLDPLAVDDVESSFFADTDRFPEGSARFDSAFLMRRIDHNWLAEPSLRVTAPVAG